MPDRHRVAAAADHLHAMAPLAMPRMASAPAPAPGAMAAAPQGVYAGLPGYVPPQATWPQHGMPSMPHGIAQGTAYGQPLQQHQYGSIFGQAIAAPRDTAGRGAAFAAHAHGAGLPPAHVSTLPPLSAEGADSMAGLDGMKLVDDYDAKAASSDAMMPDSDALTAGIPGFDGLDGALADDCGDLGQLPDEMEDFVNILAKDEQTDA